jgi:hypothetical protein
LRRRDQAARLRDLRTAFRIFIVMAGRLIKNDAFHRRRRAEGNMPACIAWVEEKGMREVVLRHAPTLAGALSNFRNSFLPWPKAGS